MSSSPTNLRHGRTWPYNVNQKALGVAPLPVAPSDIGSCMLRANRTESCRSICKMPDRRPKKCLHDLLADPAALEGRRGCLNLLLEFERLAAVTARILRTRSSAVAIFEKAGDRADAPAVKTAVGPKKRCGHLSGKCPHRGRADGEPVHVRPSNMKRVESYRASPAGERTASGASWEGTSSTL